MSNMDEPLLPPDPTNMGAWRDFALAYLRTQLGDDAPSELGAATILERSPLEGEGCCVVFAFTSRRGASPRAAKAKDQAASEPYFVVVGRTEPNYYPGYGLSADDGYSLHLGTRFMLVMGIGQRATDASDSYDAVDDARRIVSRVSSNAPVEDVQVAAMFDVDDQVHAVLRASVAGRGVYIMGRDAPTGFVDCVDLPAPVAYRLHLGRVLRAEPNPDGVNASG